MQVTLFKALKSANVDDAQATAVVEQLEEYLKTMIADATRNLEAQNKVLDSKLDSIKSGMEAKLDAQSKLIGFVGVILGILTLATAAGPTIAKLVH